MTNMPIGTDNNYSFKYDEDYANRRIILCKTNIQVHCSVPDRPDFGLLV